MTGCSALRTVTAGGGGCASRSARMALTCLRTRALCGTGSRVPPFPAFPEVNPQAGKPCRARHQLGGGFPERPASFWKQLLEAGSRRGGHACPWGAGSPTASASRRTALPGWWPLRKAGAVGRPAASAASNRLAIPSRAPWARRGERTPPGGVPGSGGVREPSATPPAFSQRGRVAVQTGRWANSGLWSRWSKPPLLAASRPPGLLSVRLLVGWLAARAARGGRCTTCRPCWCQGRWDDGLPHPVPAARSA
jgi:hypothetical protein